MIFRLLVTVVGGQFQIKATRQQRMDQSLVIFSLVAAKQSVRKGSRGWQ